MYLTDIVYRDLFALTTDEYDCVGIPVMAPLCFGVKSSFTHIADERGATKMLPDVKIQENFPRESLLAYAAFKRILVGVLQKMVVQFTLFREGRLTYIAHERFFNVVTQEKVLC